MKLNDLIKLYVFPPVISLLHKMGLGWGKLGEKTFFSKSILFAQAKLLGKVTIQKNEHPQEIYALTILSGSNFNLLIETILALGLKKKGHNVTFILDDNILPIHELKRINDEENWDYCAIRDYKFASRFLTKMKLNFIPISNFVTNEEELIYDKKYDSILEATLLKHYRVGLLTNDLPLIEEKTLHIKKSITITQLVGKKLVSFNPDVVIMSHGIYSTWGPPFNELNEKKVPILMYGRGKKKHTLKFDWNKTGDSWDVSEEWENVKDIELTNDQLKNVEQYLNSRISHKDDVYVYNFGKETSKEETFNYLGLDKNLQTYSIFTNVLWDAANAQREIAFNNSVEWVVETIQYFNEHPEKQLIVKIHPAEVIVGTNMPFNDVILSKVKPNKNIRIIKPDEKINSWSVYDITDLGMVHTTTAGMELPLVYKPCIVVSKTHYRGKGFTIDVNTKEEYFEILNNFNIQEVDVNKNKKEALKYAYLLFMRYQIPFDMFYEEVSTDMRGFKKTSIDQYFKDTNFNQIINCIEHRKPIFIK